jgi:diguanylate cyclase (GGDEF)-like protein
LAVVAAALGSLVWLGGGSRPFVAGRDGWPELAALAALFALSEVFSVHFHFTRNSHSFSLFEIPLTLGLFFAPTRAMILAHVLGSACALVFHRRQPALKLLFNLAAVALVDQLAVVVFRLLAGPSGHFGLAGIAGASCASLTASTASALLVIAVIAMAEGRVTQGLGSSIVFGGASAIVSTSLGLIAVGLIAAYPEASWLLIVPTAGLYLANYAYASEHRRHEGIEFLHNSTKLLLQTPELESALVHLVEHARKVFKAGFAELAYVPRDDTDIVEVVADESGARSRGRPLDGTSAEAVIVRAAALSSARVLERRACDPAEAAFLDERGLTDAMLAPLRGDDRVCGLLVVGNRLGDVARFDESDAVVLETFAANVTVALENSRLEQSLDDLRELQLKLTHQATHDGLTGLANRTLFASAVADALSDGDPAARRVAVMFIDLDDFKTVNDSLGHAAGDELLVVFGRRLLAAVPPEATGARLGGDEFAVVIPAIESVDHTVGLAGELLTSLTAPVAIGGRVVPAGASIGVAISTPRQSAADLLRNADTAMYAAKGRGKHCVALYQPSLHEAAIHRYNLTFELGRAITEQEFVVHYQPIVRLADRVVVGAEALVRWQHPTMGLLTPAAFVPIAEESDAIVRIGRSVLAQVCEHLAASSRRSEPTPGYIAVNLSARDLLEPSLAADLTAIIASYGVDPRTLVFEVTEGLMITDPTAAIRSLASLKDIGVRIALDDFGTGYSSLSYLRRLPLDILKIAQPFVDDLVVHATDATFVEAIVNLGRTLGLSIVAEGIEHPEQATILTALHCEYGQGYYFSPPVPPANLTIACDRIGRTSDGAGAVTQVCPGDA